LSFSLDESKGREEKIRKTRGNELLTKEKQDQQHPSNSSTETNHPGAQPMIK
jgi:hypothetical protein